MQSPPPADFTAFPPPPGMAAMPPPPGVYARAPVEPQPYIAIPYAGFWIRAVAYVIDSVFLGVIGFVLGFVFAILALIGNPNALADSQSTPVSVLSNIVDLLISFGYFAGLWTLNSGTYGQRWLGLRVLDAATFEPVRPAQAAIRWIGLVLSFLVLFLGVVWVAFDGRKQGWMDKLAGTVVVHAR